MAFELVKVKSLGVDEKTIAARLAGVLRGDPLAAAVVLAAVKVDEDVAKGLVPPEFGQTDALSKRFGEFFNKQGDVSAAEYASVDLPPFLKNVLIGIMKSESLK